MTSCPNTVSSPVHMHPGQEKSLTLLNPVPVKYEQVVFCGLSDFQLALYQFFIKSPEIKDLLRGKNSQPLKAINLLKKLCNHPELLDLPKDLPGCKNLIPEGFVGVGSHNKGPGGTSSRGGDKAGPQIRCDWGGKFLVLERCVSSPSPSSLQTPHHSCRFLHQIKTTSNDKIVLISNYTQTLDLFERLLRSKKCVGNPFAQYQTHNCLGMRISGSTAL